MPFPSLLQMTEVCSVKFTSPKDCDVVNTAQAILEKDLDLAGCNVVVRPDFVKNEVSITGSWHVISHLRNQLMSVFCSATEKHQSLVGDAIRSIVDSVLSGGSMHEGEEAKNAEFIANSANVQTTMDVSTSKREFRRL